MINFQAQFHLSVLVFTIIALIALTVTDCQQQKQAGLKEKVTIVVASLIYWHLS